MIWGKGSHFDIYQILTVWFKFTKFIWIFLIFANIEYLSMFDQLPHLLLFFGFEKDIFNGLGTEICKSAETSSMCIFAVIKIKNNN